MWIEEFLKYHDFKGEVTLTEFKIKYIRFVDLNFKEEFRKENKALQFQDMYILNVLKKLGIENKRTGCGSCPPNLFFRKGK